MHATYTVGEVLAAGDIILQKPIKINLKCIHTIRPFVETLKIHSQVRATHSEQ
jgi:hypothetical protein